MHYRGSQVFSFDCIYKILWFDAHETRYYVKSLCDFDDNPDPTNYGWLTPQNMAPYEETTESCSRCRESWEYIEHRIGEQHDNL